MEKNESFIIHQNDVPVGEGRERVRASACLPRETRLTHVKLPARGQGEGKRRILLPRKLPNPPPQSLALHLAMGKTKETMPCLCVRKRHLWTRSIRVLVRSKGTRSREQVRTHSLKGGKWVVKEGNKQGPDPLQEHAKGRKIGRQVVVADAQVRRGKSDCSGDALDKGPVTLHTVPYVCVRPVIITKAKARGFTTQKLGVSRRRRQRHTTSHGKEGGQRGQGTINALPRLVPDSLWSCTRSTC